MQNLLIHRAFELNAADNELDAQFVLAETQDGLELSNSNSDSHDNANSSKDEEALTLAASLSSALLFGDDNVKNGRLAAALEQQLLSQRYLAIRRKLRKLEGAFELLINQFKHVNYADDFSRINPSRFDELVAELGNHPILHNV